MENLFGMIERVLGPYHTISPPLSIDSVNWFQSVFAKRRFPLHPKNEHVGMKAQTTEL